MAYDTGHLMYATAVSIVERETGGASSPIESPFGLTFLRYPLYLPYVDSFPFFVRITPM